MRLHAHIRTRLKLICKLLMRIDINNVKVFFLLPYNNNELFSENY